MNGNGAAPKPPGSAVPSWLLQVLPKWFTNRPQFTEAAFAFAVSLWYGTTPIFAALYGAAAGDGKGGSLGDFTSWLGLHWFAMLMGYVFGGGIAGVRAKQAATKAACAENEPAPTKP